MKLPNVPTWIMIYCAALICFIVYAAVDLYFDYKNAIACAEKGGHMVHTDFSKVCAFVIDLDKYSIEFEDEQTPVTKPKLYKPTT